jgi:hypothetical protein
MAKMSAPAQKTRATHAAARAGEHTPSARDAALRRLSRAKRWLLAGTVTLTGVLTAVAASAFPGKSIKSTTGGKAPQEAATASSASARAGEGAGTGEASNLQPPAQEPQASVPAEGGASSGAAPEAPVVSGGS